MELRHYWHIVWRRLWIVLLLPALALVSSFLIRTKAETSYVGSATLLVTLTQEQKTGQGDYYSYDKFYTWQAATFLTDDLADFAESDGFAQAVELEMGEQPDADLPDFRAAADNRALVIEATESNFDRALQVITAATHVVEREAPNHVAELEQDKPYVSVIDPPDADRETSVTRGRIDMALRTLLGLVVGVGLVFVLHYVDRSLYEAREVEDLLQVSVLGEIPRVR